MNTGGGTGCIDGWPGIEGYLDIDGNVVLSSADGKPGFEKVIISGKDVI